MVWTLTDSSEALMTARCVICYAKLSLPIWLVRDDDVGCARLMDYTANAGRGAKPAARVLFLRPVRGCRGTSIATPEQKFQGFYQRGYLRKSTQRWNMT